MSVIEARLILEILGRPKEHVKNTLGMLVDQMDKEKGVSVKKKTIHEPVEIKDSKDMFTTFAEVEADFVSINVLFGIVFAYLTSNVEVISPSSLKFTNDEMSGVASNIMARMHFYETVTKNLIAQRDILVNKLREMGVDLSTLQIPQPKVQAKAEDEGDSKSEEKSAIIDKNNKKVKKNKKK